jgi:transcriptional regulator with XRE-family HTH domain
VSVAEPTARVVNAMVREFARTMKAHRKTLRMSMDELELHTGINRRTLYQYENGEIEPSAIRFLRICKILNIDPKDFYTY